MEYCLLCVSRFQRTNCGTANALRAHCRAHMIGVAVSRAAAGVLRAVANLYLAGGRSCCERRCIQRMTALTHCMRLGWLFHRCSTLQSRQ